MGLTDNIEIENKVDPSPSYPEGEYEDNKRGYVSIADSSSNKITFLITLLVSQAVGILSIVLVTVWLGNYRGGFIWDQAKASITFNFHPVFMTVGLIFMYGDAILVYRVFKDVQKLYVKILHAILHIGALLFSSIALRAALESHDFAKPTPIPNFYSLHSWIGILTFGLFALQWIMGLVAFLFPKLSESIRKWYLPHHKFWGIAIFCMSIATALMGITEKAIFSGNANPPLVYKELPPEAILLNFFGLSVVIFGLLIGYLVTKNDYSRPAE